jgi:hypothetical protein
MRVLLVVYLLAASLEGPVSVPSNATFRFAGLAAAMIAHLGVLREEDPSAVTAEITSFYKRLRGRLGGSTLAPRDVAEAFAGSSALWPIATDVSRSDVRARLFAELRAAGSGQESADERAALIATVSENWPAAARTNNER